MSTLDGSLPQAAPLPMRSALPLFAATLFLSAFLLFSVQPFFAKMVLPRLGGSPAVWSVAMVFFQGVLLLGYAYAHLLTSRLGLSRAALVHALVLAAALIVLPIAIPAGWERPPESGQAIWLLGLFAVSVGLPFFAVSANAPLLQAWFARTGHPHAGDPYFLYGASNVGSFASLLLFIVLVEPLFTVSQQSAMWTGGYVVLALLILASAVVAVRSQAIVRPLAAPDDVVARPLPVGASRPVRWTVLAFVPSGLLVAVTAHISVDIAAAPFLWVVPLALFLLTFVLSFARRPLFSVELLSRILPFLGAVTLIALYAQGMLPIWVKLGVHLVFFFFAALFCHSLLVAARPPAERLTSFYLWMSFGGVLGGIFASLLAPLLFNWVAEYVLLIVAALLLRPELARRPRAELSAFAVVALIVGAAILLAARFDLVAVFSSSGSLSVMLIAVAFAALGVHFLSQTGHALLLALFVPLAFLQSQAAGQHFHERSFFGVVRVTDSTDGRFRLMTHGTTLHGAMEIMPLVTLPGVWAPEPLTYYHASGGMAAAIRAMQERRGGAMAHAGAVGLGTGSAICHRAPGERWTAFEIDRSVVDAALDPQLFSFMPVCGADVPIVIGDARVTLADQPEADYDLLLIDAFSSDSIPVHLMTREAVALYISRTTPDGIVVMHISNRYLELASVLAAIAREEGLAIRTGLFSPDDPQAAARYINSSHVAVIARDESHFGQLLDDERWIVPDAGDTRAWTDDYSNILAAILRKH